MKLRLVVCYTVHLSNGLFDTEFQWVLQECSDFDQFVNVHGVEVETSFEFLHAVNVVDGGKVPGFEGANKHGLDQVDVALKSECIWSEIHLKPVGTKVVAQLALARFVIVVVLVARTRLPIQEAAGGVVRDQLTLVVGELPARLGLEEEVVRAQLARGVPAQLPFGDGFLAGALAVGAKGFFVPYGMTQLVGHLLESIAGHAFQDSTWDQFQ